jgi:hypothetical protein
VLILLGWFANKALPVAQGKFIKFQISTRQAIAIFLVENSYQLF